MRSFAVLAGVVLCASVCFAATWRTEGECTKMPANLAEFVATTNKAKTKAGGLARNKIGETDQKLTLALEQLDNNLISKVSAGPVTNALQNLINAANAYVALNRARKAGAKALADKAVACKQSVETKAGQLKLLVATIKDQCDPAKTANLISTNKAHRKAAVKGCLDALKVDADGVFAQYAAYTKHPYDGKLTSRGHSSKLDRWASGKGTFAEWFDGFALGRETLLAAETLEAELKDYGVSAADAVAKLTDASDAVKNKPAFGLSTDAQAPWDDARTAWKADKTSAPKAKLAAGFEVYKHAQIYPLIGSAVIFVEGKAADARTIADTDVDGWDSVNFGRNSERNKGFVAGWNLATTVKARPSSSAGIGNYFGINNVQTETHGDDFIQCKVDGLKIVDKSRDTPESEEVFQNLVTAKIALNPQDGGNDFFNNPNRYNQWLDPVTFEAAARESRILVMFRSGPSTSPPYVVDKGAVDFTQCKRKGQGFRSMRNKSERSTIARILGLSPSDV